jgi:superfamily II DNA/RNA helicase
MAEYLDSPSPFEAAALEVVAEIFALECRRLALLVLPAEMPVKRAVWELRQLGVEARGLDVRSDRRQLLSSLRLGQSKQELLVSTEASTRGLDIWGLSHVFIYGAPQGYRRVDQYLHLAGRVGRVGRGRATSKGKVVSVVVERDANSAAEAQEAGISARLIGRDEVKELTHVYSKLGIRPTRYESYM